MTKRKFEWYRNFFVLCGALFIGLGVLTPFRTKPETLWEMMWMVGLTIMQIIMALMLLSVARTCHKKAQTAKE
jgi:hypothetical protein